MGVGGQGHAPAALPPGKSPDTHCAEGWVGSKAGMIRYKGNILPAPGFEPRNGQLVARCSTHYAIPAPKRTHMMTWHGHIWLSICSTSEVLWTTMNILAPQTDGNDLKWPTFCGSWPLVRAVSSKESMLTAHVIFNTSTTLMQVGSMSQNVMQSWNKEQNVLNLPSRTNSEPWKLRHDAYSIQGTPETERKPISRYRVHNTVPYILPNPLHLHPNTHKPGTLNIRPSTAVHCACGNRTVRRKQHRSNWLVTWLHMVRTHHKSPPDEMVYIRVP